MKNIHFINVTLWTEKRALDVFLFFLGSDCIERKQKHTKSTGNSCVGKKTTTEQRVPPPTQRDKAQVHTQKIQTNKCRLQRRKETNYRGRE